MGVMRWRRGLVAGLFGVTVLAGAVLVADRQHAVEQERPEATDRGEAAPHPVSEQPTPTEVPSGSPSVTTLDPELARKLREALFRKKKNQTAEPAPPPRPVTYYLPTQVGAKWVY